METYSKQSLRLNRNNKGQSLFEVVIAMALISIVLITLVAMASVSIRAAVFSRNQTQASRFTEQASEWLRSEKDANWATFSSYAATQNWCLDSLYWQKGTVCSVNSVISGTIFVRNLKFTVNADSSISADIQTSWVDAQGSHLVTTSIVFTNWQSDFIATASPVPTPTPTLSHTPTPTPVPGNYANCISVTAPATVSAGTTFAATVTMRNGGTTTWKNASVDPTNFDGLTNWPWPPTTFSAVWNVLPQATVAPGQNVTFSFNDKAPLSHGTYPFAWKMIQQGVAWFGEVCSQDITVQ